jgi:hypothetical protein
VGMVQHWQRLRGPGWPVKLAINGIGALTTGVVTLIVVTTKFVEGAWIVLILIPVLVAGFARIHAHYAEQAREMDVGHPPPPSALPHNVLIPVARLDRAVTAAVAYALSIGGAVQAVHVVIDESEAAALRSSWAAWGVPVPLELVASPYRGVVGPLLHEIKRIHQEVGGRVTVVLPEVVPRHWWQEGLHNQTALSLQLALRRAPDVVVTTVPVQLAR